MNRAILLLVPVLLFVFLSSCGSVSYYTQSIIGHSRLMLARKPIDQVLLEADEPLKQRLTTAMAIRRFAVTGLALPDNGSYTTYVQLKNDPPVWNVVAAEEFSLKAYQWCYPIIGCASYRGYYHKEAAEKYAAKMKARGYDVAVIGAVAYSTLGWFADPLTSAMLNRDDASLADLLFHELAHQRLYIKHNSSFNEAFASTVGEQGALRWLRATGRDSLLAAYQTRLSVRDDFLALISQAKRDLRRVYEAELPAPIKRERKQRVFDAMRRSHQQLQREQWGNKPWYNNWFDQPLNNARLVAIGTYRDRVPELVAWFNRCGKDFQRFYQQAAVLAETKPSGSRWANGGEQDKDNEWNQSAKVCGQVAP